MTQTTECGYCRETYEVEDQTLAPTAVPVPLHQCAACARLEARGSGGRKHFMSDGDDCYEQPDWLPDDRVELVDWQPSDRVWLTSNN